MVSALLEHALGSWDLDVVVGSALIGAVVGRISSGAGVLVAALGAALEPLAPVSIEARRRSEARVSAA